MGVPVQPLNAPWEGFPRGEKRAKGELLLPRGPDHHA